MHYIRSPEREQRRTEGRKGYISPPPSEERPTSHPPASGCPSLTKTVPWLRHAASPPALGIGAFGRRAAPLCLREEGRLALGRARQLSQLGVRHEGTLYSLGRPLPPRPVRQLSRASGSSVPKPSPLHRRARSQWPPPRWKCAPVPEGDGDTVRETVRYQPGSGHQGTEHGAGGVLTQGAGVRQQAFHSSDSP